MWSREEALAEVTAVEVVELPFSPSQANFETLQEEFGAHPNGRVVRLGESYRGSLSGVGRE